MTKPHVGSAGYESQSFHFEQGNIVTLKNGTIKSEAPVVIQNYCDLTLEDLTIEGTEGAQYAVSCNAGNTTLTNVSISGTGDFTALDVMHWHGKYPAAPSMMVKNTSTNAIRGKVAVYCYGTGSDSCTSGAALTITGGTYSNDVGDYVAKDYVSHLNTDGLYHVHQQEDGYGSDANGHWTICVAEEGCQGIKGDVTAHTFDAWVADTPAQVGVAGARHRNCSVCGYREDGTIAALTGGVYYPSTSRPGKPVEDIKDPDVPMAELPLPFEDVKDGDWYREAVAFMYKHKLMLGVSDKLFGVDANTTRGMMATVIYRLEKEPEATFEKIFNDVDNGKWYSKAITWGSKNGILLGYDNGGFGPEDDVTREQLVTLLYRYAAKKGYDVSEKADLSAFADADDVSGYARDAMGWAVAVGLVHGRGADRLAPTDLALRVEVAAIFQRFATLYEVATAA